MTSSMRGVSLLLAYLCSLAASEPELLKACRMRDMECIRDTTQQFLEKTSRGVPDMGLRPIDPLLVPRLDYDLPQLNVTHHVTNLNITGLKQLEISNFGMDAGYVTLSFNVSVSTEGEIAVDYHLPSTTKTIPGNFSSHFQFVANTSYPYSLVKDESNVTHYVVGAETTDFHVLGTPDYQLSNEYLDAAKEDPDVSSLRTRVLATQRAELEHEMLSRLVHVIVPALVHNIRTAAAILPVTAFFVED